MRNYALNVWRTQKKSGKLNLFIRDGKAVNMHSNPVKRGLVNHPKDWSWSSWVSYEKGESELIRIDPVG